MGNANFIISVKDEKGQPVKNATVAFDLNMTAMNMGTQQGTATPQGDGTYAATGKLTMRGPWKVSTKITMPDGKLMNKDFTVEAQ
jgi:nitrogen fixation protein FixH